MRHQEHNRTVYVIAGPTAAGKTAVAIALAKRLGTSVISADSRQCYKELTIGTAKPSPEELRQVRHYFIDAFPITEHVTAADFELLALQYLDDIFLNATTAVVCGGTGLYLKALTDGLDEMPAMDPEVEETVNRMYREKGLPWLQEELERKDPVFFAGAEVRNPARLLRALIFKLSTGRSITEFRTGTKKVRPFRIIRVALQVPRDILYRRIDLRVDRMMEQGLLEEVRGLQRYRQLKSLQTVGYAELFDHLDGKYTLQEAVGKIKQHTRNYAKRQLTWFGKDKEYTWLNADDPDLVEKILALKE